MAFKDLTSKLKKGILAATVGLASLAYAPKADGQIVVDMNTEVRHAGNNQIVTGPLQEGQTYLINLTLENIDPAGIPGADLSFRDIFASLKADYSNGLNSGNTDFTYVQPSISGQEGTPLVNDIFNGSTGASNNYAPITGDSFVESASFSRSVTGNFPALNYEEKANVATFLFTPHLGTQGGTLTLSYNLNEDFILTRPDFETYDGQVQFFQGANQINFNIAAVPEPSTYALFAGGAALAAAAAYRAKRRRENSKKN